MSKSQLPERPRAVEFMEMAIAAKVDAATPFMVDIINYIQQLEAHAAGQQKAIGYLHTVIETGGATTEDEQATVRFVAEHMITGKSSEEMVQ